MRSIAGYLIIAGWGGLCLFAILLMSKAQMVEYDPNLALATATSDLSFEQKLVDKLSNQFNVKANSIVHIQGSDCFCQNLTNNHIQNLDKTFLGLEYKSHTIQLKDAPELTKYIPSTPSFIVIGSQQELIYLGPYSIGYGCITGTSLADNIAKKIDSEFSENSLIVTEAKGCYCHS